MAGIFSDVSTDIQKLRQLKAEIENVKKSLKGIDVNVNIDIAKGMEAQLQSLMKQYDALVKKVSEAEGKIMISTKRINDASEKIIKAQEQLSKAAGMNPQPSNGNADVSLNNVGTASVRAQAKAYDELAEEIDSVMGTRSQNIKRMIDEQNAIRLINEEIKRLTKLQTGNSTLTNTEQKRLEQLNNSLLTHKAALSDVRQTLMNNVKLDNAATTSMNGLSQSLSRMRVAYRELTEEERNSPFGKELLASIQQADTRIKELDATIGNHQRNVGNYAKGYNGLNMSVQQIVRELPSAAMGLNMFFLAISNNLPILTDEIKRAKTANEELKASGQKGVPVWKQVASSLFSWQSALMVGITLLTVHGDKVWEWINSLFKAKDAATSLSGVTSELNKSMSENDTGYGKNIATLNKLQSKWKELDDDLSKQKTFICENKDAFSELGVSINDVNDAEKILSDNTGQFIKTLDLRAKAAAAYQLAIKKAEEAFQHGIAADEILKGGANVWDYWNAGIDVLGNLDWVIQGGDVWNPEKFTQGRAGKELIASDKANSQFQMLMQLSEQFAEKRKEALKQMGLTDDDMNLVSGSIEAIEAAISAKREALKKVTNRKDYIKIESEIKTEEAKLKAITGNTTKEQQEKERQKKEQQQLAEELLQLRFKNQQEEINLMEEGSEKKRRQIELDYQREIDEIRKQRKKWEDAQEGKLTSEQREVLGSRASNAITSREKGLAEITETENQAAIEANERYLKSYGTFMQKRDAIIAEYTRKISEATTQGDKDILQKEMDKALSSLDLGKLKQGINWELIFGDLDKVSKESLEKIKQQLKDFKNSDEYKNMAVDQKKVIDEALNNIQTTLIDKGGLLGDLPNQLSELAQAQEELAKAQEEYNEAMKDGTDEQKEAAAKKLNDAQKRQQNAQTNVQKSTDKTIGNLVTLSNVITELGANSEVSLSQIVKLAGDVVDIFSETESKVGGIIGAAFSLLDAVGTQGLDGFVGNVFGSVFRSVGGVWDTLTFGLIGNHESDRTLHDDIERLTISNQDLKMALDNLADKMEESSIADASGIYEQQRSNILQSMANTQEMMQRSGAAYSNGFWGIGGSHSSNNKIDTSMSAEDWKRVSEAAGVSVTNAGDFWNLTSEQMYNVANDATDLYSKIKSLADDGYENAAQYMDEYIGYWEQLEELEDAYHEKLTSVSFDTVRDDFKSNLLDMESDTDDFAESFENKMKEAIIESMMSDTYSKRLKDWYRNFSSSMEDGRLSDSEQQSLKKEWDSIVSDALAERDELLGALGIDGSSSGQQSASGKGFETMSQDSADELNGRFTAVYESNLRIETATQQQTVAITELRGSISALASQTTGLYNIADETRTILANSYLELQQIRENTGEIIEPIKKMQKDISEVKKNTAKL